MKIRNAEDKDVNGVLELLSQVLEIHAELRPDIFISGTTKYSEEELFSIFKDNDRRTFVAVDDDDNVLGYAFCEIKKNNSQNLVPFTTLYVDDLCVDKDYRGKGIAKSLFEYVKSQAAEFGCYDITLNVWDGNDVAKAFYEKVGMKPKSTQMEYILKK